MATTEAALEAILVALDKAEEAEARADETDTAADPVAVAAIIDAEEMADWAL